MTMMAHHHHRVSSLSSPSKSSFSAFLDLVRVAGSRHRARGTIVSPVNPTKGKNVNTLTLEDDGKKNVAPKRVDYVRDQRRASHEVSLETPESEREPERERIGVLFEGDYASKVREIDDFIKVETFCDDESEFLRVV